MGREGEAGPEVPALHAEGAARRLPRPGSDPLVYSKRGFPLEDLSGGATPTTADENEGRVPAPEDAVGLRTAQV